MKQIKIFLTLLVLAITVDANTSYADDVGVKVKHLNFGFGSRSFTYSGWEHTGVNSQTPMDIKLDIIGEGDWVNTLLGYSMSSKEVDCTNYYNAAPYTVSCKAAFSEFYLGGVKYWEVGESFSPFFGLGVSYITGVADVTLRNGGTTITSANESNASFGYFIYAGTLYKIGSINIGLDAKMLAFTNWDRRNPETNMNYTQFGLLVGYGW